MEPRRLRVRVYYEDTDFSGAVYHASYLRFLERGRTEFLRDIGVDQSALHRRSVALAFVVRRMLIDWLKPARMDDLLFVETQPMAIQGACLVMTQRISRDDELLVAADVRIALLQAGRPTRLPLWLRERLE